MAAGDFTKTALLKVPVMADDIWADSRLNIEMIAETKVMRAIQERQTAIIKPFSGTGANAKDFDISLKWTNTCAITVQDCTADCAITGTELESDEKNYALSLCKEATPFKVAHKKFRTNELDAAEVVTKGLLKQAKALDEFIAQTAISKIDSFAGTNVYAGTPGSTVGADGHTYIPSAADWNVSLMPHLLLAGRFNKFTSPYVISGTQLYVEWWNKKMDSMNGEGKGDGARIQAIPFYFDVVNVDTVITPDKALYLLQTGAIAFANRHYNEGVRELSGDRIAFTFASRNIAGVTYDVFAQETCVGNEEYTAYKMVERFDLFLNPSMCDNTNTGVLKYVEATAP